MRNTKTDTMDDYSLLTAEEAASLLRLSRRKLWELTNRGEIPSLRIDRAVRYSRIALKRWIERRQQGKG